jgi:triacylglycerol lipase
VPSAHRRFGLPPAVTRYDELVVPYTSGILDRPGVKNIVVQDQCGIDFAEHAALAFDPVAAQDVLNALDPANARPPRCTLVLPFVGAPVR